LLRYYTELEFFYFVNETSFSLTGFSSKGSTIQVLLLEKVSDLSAEVGSTTPYCNNFFVHYLGGDEDLNTLKNLVLQAELVGNTQVGCQIAHCSWIRIRIPNTDMDPGHPSEYGSGFLTPVFRIRALVVRILIVGSVPRTNGSGPCFFLRYTPIHVICFAYYFLKIHLHYTILHK
jgi:hypothetical protein